MVECDKCRRDITEVLSIRKFIGNDFNGPERKWWATGSDIFGVDHDIWKRESKWITYTSVLHPTAFSI